MLLGAKLNVYTDHHILNFGGPLNTQRVLRWRIYVKEYSPIIPHILGRDNVLVDTYSRLPRLDLPDAKRKQSDDEVISKGSFVYSSFELSELFDCLLNLPVPSTHEITVGFQWIKQHQDNDSILQQGLPDLCFTKNFGGFDLLCYVSPNNDVGTQWRMCLLSTPAYQLSVVFVKY